MGNTVVKDDYVESDEFRELDEYDRYLKKPPKSSGKKKKKKRKKKMRRIRILIIVFLVLAAGVAGFLIYEDSFVYGMCEVEAGTTVSISDFLKREDPDARFTNDSDQIDVFTPGEYHLKIKTGMFEHRSTLVVKDTIPPVYESHDIATGRGVMPEAAECVKNIVDVTKCTVSFTNPPNVNEVGDVKAEVAVTDLGGNRVASQINISVWPIKGYLRVEAGQKTPELADFMLDGNTDNAQLLSDLSTIDMSEVDEIPIKISYKGVTYEPKLTIYDNTPPEFTVKNIDSFLNVPRAAEDFVVETKDNSKVTYTFEVAPDLTREGSQKLVIVGTDGGGNVTKKDVTLTLAVDREAPKFNNVKDIKIFVGRTVSYKNNLDVTDNCPEGLKLDIDAGSVNTNVAGTYDVKATATDLAGNSTSVSFKVTVAEVASTQEDLNILADEVLEQIITPGMSVMQKLRAIYDYVYTHCRYRDMNIDGDWIKAAASGFLTGKGDCYTDTMMCRALLNRIGVKNSVINRIKGNDADHYWNLVDIGDGYGWYHLDCLNRMDGVSGYKIFMLKTDEVIKIDNLIGDFHDFDRSKYPDVDPGTVEKTYDFPEAVFNNN
ncbi:MAG: transglutaminase domain-containing protein, partial [Lachnospiraceae bacterium]|nr:transglutaminase domain-containing protein [Lachnospiraceae bacterium]